MTSTVTSTEYQTVRTAFLSAGPVLNCEIPADYHPTPQLRAPVSLDPADARNARECAFVPSALDNGGVARHNYERVGSLDGADGRSIELYWQADPGQWFLRWALSSGAVYIHVRKKDDGREFVDLIAQHLHIYDVGGGTPSILADPPLGRGVSSLPGYHEEVDFFLLEAPGFQFGVDPFPGVISLKRPGLLPSGTVYSRPSRAIRSFVRLGAPGGIEIEVGGDMASVVAKAYAQRLAVSLVA
jgi:hypothetical protein